MKKNLKRLTKKGLVEYLKAAETKVKDDTLVDRIVYTIGKADSTLKADLLDLADEVQNTLAAQNIVAAVENSKKEGDEVDIKAVPKKPKKSKKAKPKAVPVKGDGSAVKELAESFPEKVLVGEEEYSIDYELKTIEDVVKALDEGKKIVFAFYWNKRHLKQFPYDMYGICSKKIKEFPQDLDLAQVLYPTRENTALYCVSLYSDVLHIVLKDNMEIVDNMRFANGVEFNIYTK